MQARLQTRAPRRYPLLPMVSGIVENAMPSIMAINDTMTVGSATSSECPRPIQPRAAVPASL